MVVHMQEVSEETPLERWIDDIVESFCYLGRNEKLQTEVASTHGMQERWRFGI